MKAWRTLSVGQTVWWPRESGQITQAVIQELPETLRDLTGSKATTDKGGPPMAYVAIGEIWDLVACSGPTSAVRF